MDDFHQADPEVLLYGEVLWDMLPAGAFLGGAPLNVAWNLHHLGVATRIMSSLGEDAHGQAARERLEQAGLPTELLQTTVEGYPTGYSQVTLAGEGVPSFALPEPVAYDDILPGPEAADVLATVRVLYYGTLAARAKTSRHTLAWLWNMEPEVARFCDLNLRAPYYDRQTVSMALSHADFLKINEEELVELSRMELIPGNADVRRDLSQAVKSLAHAHGLRAIFLTRGPEPLLAWHEQDCPEPREFPVPPPVDPAPDADTIGAGDAFSAGVIQGLVRGWDFDRTVRQGLRSAAAVCGIAGAQAESGEYRRRMGHPN